MPVNSKRKGRKGEQDSAKYLRSLGFPDARRTQQYNGEGKSDVTCPESLPSLHIEVKFGYPISDFDIQTDLFSQAIAQAEGDSGTDRWVVLWKPKRHQRWRLSFRAFGDVVTVCAPDDRTARLLLLINQGHFSK